MNYSLTLAGENRIHRLKSIQILTFKGKKEKKYTIPRNEITFCVIIRSYRQTLPPIPN